MTDQRPADSTLPRDAVDLLHAHLLDDPALSPNTDAIIDVARARWPLAGGADIAALVRAVRARVDGMGPLEPLFRDPSITDILVNGPGTVWVDGAAGLQPTGIHISEHEIVALIERLLAPTGRRLDRSSPLVDARLADGSRLNAVLPPLAVDGPYLAIRRFGVRRHRLDTVASTGVARLLLWGVHQRCNILVVGPTGAGKTTLLNELAAEISDDQRIVTVEDVAELRLVHRHVVRFEARPANADGLGAVSIRELVRNALRMRPDRFVVGEVRGPEAMEMVWALSTGHDGSLSTMHANDPDDAISRLETMVLTAESGLPHAQVRAQIRSAVDLVVHVGRRVDGARRVLGVAEVTHEAIRLLTGDDGDLTRRPTLRGRHPAGRAAPFDERPFEERPFDERPADDGPAPAGRGPDHRRPVRAAP